MDENVLIKELVAQFLAHDGYVETARTFAEEVQSEDRALNGGSVTSFDNLAVEEDLDAVKRQRISKRYPPIPQGLIPGRNTGSNSGGRYRTCIEAYQGVLSTSSTR